MARRRRRVKRKNTKRSSTVSQSEGRHSHDKKRRKNGKLTKNSQTYDHPYATRSKTSNNLEPFTNPNERKGARRKLSENSVIFLGAFRKIPQLIDLEDTTQSTTPIKLSIDPTSRPSYQELCEQISVGSWFKVEPADC